MTPDMHTALLDRYQGQVDADEARSEEQAAQAGQLRRDFFVSLRGGDHSDALELLQDMDEEDAEQIFAPLLDWAQWQLSAGRANVFSGIQDSHLGEFFEELASRYVAREMGGAA